MRIGALRESLTFYLPPTATLDTYGAPTDALVPRCVQRAQLLAQHADADLNGAGIGADHSLTFRMRYLPDITPGDPVQFRGAQYRVKAVQETRRKREIELTITAPGV